MIILDSRFCGNDTVTMDKEKINKILAETEIGYDSIADKFSSTRAFMWRDLGFVKDLMKPGDRVLDFGCGNGRLAGFLQNNYGEYVGVDVSQKLINIARDNNRELSSRVKFLKINSKHSKLPFEDNYFDVIFSIAVFHHFPTKEYRLKAAKELHRVLKPNGKIIVSVWQLFQKRYLKYHIKAIKEKIIGKSGMDWGDLHIPFKDNEKIFQRYHHTFRKGETERLFSDAGFKKINLKKGRNLLYIGEK